jgi:hypothetical protein
MGSETGVGCRFWFASASPRAPRSRTSFRVAPYGDASVIMARNNATFLFGLLTEHGGYPRVAGLGAAVERKIKLIRESPPDARSRTTAGAIAFPVILRPQNRVLPQRVIGILLRALFCLNRPTLA